MTEQEWMEKLANEGYQHLSIAKLPAEFDDLHTHDEHTVHVMLEGELILIAESGTALLKPGDYFEIPAGTTHKAKTGQGGCRMIVGWR
jgi:quercetin dioxygenase-like cupin family protein